MSEQRSTRLQDWGGRAVKTGRTALLAVLLVTLPLVIHGSYVKHRHFVQNQESTTGTVIDRNLDCFNVNCFGSITVRFTDATGTSIEYREVPHTGDEQIGQEVTVFYDSDDPQYADLSPGWRLEMILFLAVLITFWLGTLVHLVERFRPFFRKPEPLDGAMLPAYKPRSD